MRSCPVINTYVFGQDRYNPSNAPVAYRFILRRYSSSLTQQTLIVNPPVSRLTHTLSPRIMATMETTTKNIIKVSAVSAAFAACITMSTVCVIATLNYESTRDDTQSAAGEDSTDSTDSTTPAPVQLNQCVDAAAINCVHLPDDQSHAYYVNVGGHQWTYEGDTPAPNAGEYLGGGYYQTFNPYQAVNATGDSIALGAKFSADMGN